MGNKRTIHVEIDGRTFVNMDGIQKGLEGLASKAEDSYDFEEILNYAINGLYLSLPNGQENYGGDKSTIGRLDLTRWNSVQGHANLDYNPSEKYKTKLRYEQKHLVYIDLRNKIYTPNWHIMKEINDNEYLIGFPMQLIKDSMAVMERLNIKKIN